MSETAGEHGRTEDERRQRILGAAEAACVRHGYTRVTMDDLAAELGMSKKTIYQHFPGKEHLFLAVIDRFFGEVQAGIDAILADERLPFTDKVRRFLAFMASRVSRVQSHVMQDVKRTMPRGWSRVEELRRQTVQTRLAVLIGAGMAEGKVRPDLNQHLLVLILLTLVQQIGTPETMAQVPVSTAELFHHITTVFFEGILTDEARADLAG